MEEKAALIQESDIHARAHYGMSTIYTLIIIIHSCQECWLCNTYTVLSKTLQCIQHNHYRSIDHNNIATLPSCVYQLLDYHKRVHAHVPTLVYADTINHAHIASTPIYTLTYS